MFVNVTDLRIQKRWTKDRDGTERETLELTITTQDDDGTERRMSPMLHCSEHVRELVDDLQGDTPHLHRHAYSDVGYMIANAHPRGMEIWRRESAFSLMDGKRSWHLDCMFATFPGKDIARAIRSLHVSQYNPRAEWTASRETIARWHELYGPRIRVVFRDDAAYTAYRDTAKGDAHAEMVDDEQRARLKDAMHHLARMARNHSDAGTYGAPTTVHVALDHMGNDDAPPSFYWRVVEPVDGSPNKARLVMEGGIIAHAEREKPEEGDAEDYYKWPVSQYTYCTHT